MSRGEIISILLLSFLLLLHASETKLSLGGARGIYSARILIFSPNLKFYVDFFSVFFKTVSLLSPVFTDVLSFPPFYIVFLFTLFPPLFPFFFYLFVLLFEMLNSVPCFFLGADFPPPSLTRFCELGRIYTLGRS